MSTWSLFTSYCETSTAGVLFFHPSGQIPGGNLGLNPTFLRIRIFTIFFDIQKDIWTSLLCAKIVPKIDCWLQTYHTEKMEHQWYFSKDKICDSPNMKFHQDPYKELAYKLRATTFMQLIGQKLELSQHSISTATVYFHRFYMFYSLKDVDPKKLSMVAILLAAKTQNEYRKLEHIVKVAYVCLDRSFPAIDVKSKFYLTRKEKLIFLENVLLQLLGFEVDMELPHPYIIKICQLIRGSQELAKKSYLLATASLMVSTLCLQYKPATMACVCLNLGARWSQIEIDPGKEEHPWFYYIDPSLRAECLNELTDELGKTILKGALSINSPVLNCVVSDNIVETPFTTTEASATETSINDEKLSIVPAATSLP